MSRPKEGEYSGHGLEAKKKRVKPVIATLGGGIERRGTSDKSPQTSPIKSGGEGKEGSRDEERGVTIH